MCPFPLPVSVNRCFLWKIQNDWIKLINECSKMILYTLSIVWDYICKWNLKRIPGCIQIYLKHKEFRHVLVKSFKLIGGFGYHNSPTTVLFYKSENEPDIPVVHGQLFEYGWKTWLFCQTSYLTYLLLFKHEMLYRYWEIPGTWIRSTCTSLEIPNKQPFIYLPSPIK